MQGVLYKCRALQQHAEVCSQITLLAAFGNPPQGAPRTSARDPRGPRTWAGGFESSRRFGERFRVQHAVWSSLHGEA